MRKKAPEGDGDDLRTGRLMTRMHPHLMALLDVRARERGESRSRYIERVLIGFLRSDPRNPKLDAMGRLVDGAPDPWSEHQRQPHQFGERWTRFREIYATILGGTLTDEDRDDERRYRPVWLTTTDHGRG